MKKNILIILLLTTICILSFADDFIFVEGGTFSMGNASRDDNEKPVHSVMVNSFYMSKYEVTNEQVVEVFNWGLSRGELTADNESIKNKNGNSKELLDLDDMECQIIYSQGKFSVLSSKEDHPCIEVTWYGAVVFSNLLSMMEGLDVCYDLSTWKCDFNANGYRLPTEAEWEFAARGGNNSRGYRYSGSNGPGDVAWYHSGSGGTHPVGQKNTNELGLYDMSGNVNEWCWDWYSSDYYLSSPSSNPEGPSSGSNRVTRGGNWYASPNRIRCTCRSSLAPGFSSGLVGFRPVREQ